MLFPLSPYICTFLSTHTPLSSLPHHLHHFHALQELLDKKKCHWIFYVLFASLITSLSFPLSHTHTSLFTTSHALQELLDKNKWCRILLEFGSFPDKYRRVIWTSVLELPRNYSVFSALLDKGTHPAYRDLGETLQLSDTGLFKALQR